MRLSMIRKQLSEDIDETDILKKLGQGPTEKMFSLDPEGKEDITTGTGHQVKGKGLPLAHSHPGSPLPSAQDIISLHKAWSELGDEAQADIYHAIKGSKDYDYAIDLRRGKKFRPNSNVSSQARRYENAVKDRDFEAAKRALEEAGFEVRMLKA